MVTTRRLPFVLSQITLATALVMTQFSGAALASDVDPTRSWWENYFSSATLLDETDVEKAVNDFLDGGEFVNPFHSTTPYLFLINEDGNILTSGTPDFVHLAFNPDAKDELGLLTVGFEKKSFQQNNECAALPKCTDTSAVNLSDYSYEITRDANLTLKTTDKAALLYLTDGGKNTSKTSLYSSLEGTVFTESADASGLHVSSGGVFTIEKGAQLNLNLYFQPKDELITEGNGPSVLKMDLGSGIMSVAGRLGIDAQGQYVKGVSVGESWKFQINDGAEVDIFSAYQGIEMRRKAQINIDGAEVAVSAAHQALGMLGGGRVNIEGSDVRFLSGNLGIGMDDQSRIEMNGADVNIFSAVQGIEMQGGSTIKLVDSDLNISAGNQGIDLQDGSEIKMYGGSLTLKAKNLFSGSGSITASNGAVTLDGSLDNFSGKYIQTSGSLVLQGSTSLTKNMYLGNVTLVGASENIFSASAEEWKAEGGRIYDLSPLFTPYTLTGTDAGRTIMLTDDVVHITYLLDLADKLSNTKFYVGAVEEGGTLITNLTLQQYKELTTELPELVLTRGLLRLEPPQPDAKGVVLSESVEIGKVQMTHGGVLTIADGATLSLYWQEGGNVFMNTDSVVIEEKSGLHIGKTELARLSGVRQWVNVATEVKEGGTLSLEGVVGFTSAARVDSSGTVRISDFAQVGTLSSVTQKGGEISIGNGAELVMGEGTELTLKDAVLTSSGFLSAPALKTENSQLSLQSGGIRDSSVTLWETGGSTEVSLEAGARLTVDELKGEGLRFTVAGDSAAYSAASFGDYSEVKNSQFVVASSGLLVLGAHEIGFGLQDTLDAVERLSPLEGRAVLAVNDSVRLAAGSSLSVGSDKTLQSGADSTVTLGKDSVLIILPELTSAAFSGGESGLAVVKEEGAQVYVLDALQKTWVADAGVEWDKPFEDTEIVSANRNVVLEMRKEKDNWVIAAKEVLTNQFVYPTLQGTLYQGDISVDSDNASERFFARADNMEFIDEAADAPALIAEVTQQSVLLGVRNTALSAAGLHEKARSVVLDAMPEGTLRPLVYLQGERRDARKLGGYLGDAGYTAKSTGIVIGGEYYPRSDTRLSLTAAGSRITTDAKKSVLAAKGRQNVYGAEFEAVSSFGAFNFGGRAGASWFKTKMNGQLPEKMDMGASFGKHRETLLSASLFAEARVHPNISLTLSPTLWHFSGDTVSTSLGGESAFSQNIESKNLFEIPLGVKVHKKTRLKSGWDLGVAAEADGALRLGSLSQKSRLHAAGTGAYENISQREFSRWKSGVDLSFSASKKNFEARGELGVSRGTRETAFGGGVRLNWKF